MSGHTPAAAASRPSWLDGAGTTLRESQALAATIRA
jgi:hypothetical protein